jgi:predicted permease
VLRRTPAFTLTAVLSLALGVGANTAVFSLADELLLRPLPVSRPERLYFVDNMGGKSDGSNGPPFPCYELMRDTARSFSGLAMFSPQSLRAGIDGADERVRAQYASGNYFDVLGVHALYGRTFTPDDDRRGGGVDGPVAVIGYDFWKTRFAADPAVVGKRIQIAGKTTTIVGVTPAEFFGLTVGAPVDLTVPVTLSDTDLARPRLWWFSVVGRLNDGASVGAARAELDTVFRSFMTSTFGHPPKPDDVFNRIELVPAERGLDTIRRQFSSPLAIVMTIVALVLLTGCANVASLVLARATARETEMAVRVAIGAGRGRLVRQLLTEGLVLAVLGALAGLVVSSLGVAVILRMAASTREPIVLAPSLDGRVLTFTAGVALLTGLLCSLAPAFSTAGAARGQAAGRVTSRLRTRRLGRSLVVVQITLSLVLLCGAGLFVRTLRNLEDSDAGFRSAGVLTIPVEAVLTSPPPGADEQAAKARVGRTWRELADRAGRLPGVSSAAVSVLAPMSGRDRGVNLDVVGAPPLPEEQRGIRLNHVSPGYFETLGVQVLAGRTFLEADRKTVVLAKTAARTYFGEASPIGRFVEFGNPAYGRYQVVGVVEDTRYESLREEPARVVYLPIDAPIDAIRGVFLTLRTTADAGSIAAAVREDARQSLSEGFVGTPRTLDDEVNGSLLQERLVAMLSTVFGVLALALASIGIYGLLSYTVARRTREFGVRMALGATRRELIWIVLRETVFLAGPAVACGLSLVAALGRYVRTALFDVSPTDPTAIGSAVVLLLSVGLAAACLPARRAGAIEPVRALRED